jgi:hypothetical protein
MAEALLRSGLGPNEPQPASALREADKPPRPAPAPAATSQSASRAPAATAAKRPSKKPVMPQRPIPDFSGLPPAMAQSLARLAGVPWPPPEGSGAGDADEREFEDEGAPTRKSGR